MKKTNENQIVEIPADKIYEPKMRARIDFDSDEMTELMQDINRNGLINPVTVKSVRGGYEIVAGERRTIAMKRLKWKTIPCLIRKGTLVEMEIIKFSENMKRSNLTDIEEAYSLDRLMDKTKKTAKQVAKMINKSESYVKQKTAILKYPDYLYNAIAQKLISFSAARELARIKDETTLRDYVGFAVRSGITPGVAKEWADDWIMRTSTIGKTQQEADQMTSGKTVEEPRFPCALCGEMKKVSETQLIRICLDDEKCDEKRQENS